MADSRRNADLTGLLSGSRLDCRSVAVGVWESELALEQSPASVNVMYQLLGLFGYTLNLTGSSSSTTSRALTVAVVITIWMPMFSLLPSCLSGSLGGVFLENWTNSLMISLLTITVSAALVVDRTPSVWSLIYFCFLAGFSAYSGEWLGFHKWGCSLDPIERSWLPYWFWLGAAMIALCELLGIWLLRRLMLRLPVHLRWIILFICCAYGPTMLLATPFIVQMKLNRENSLAIKRLTLIEAAFLRAATSGKSCDTFTARKSYSGSGFSRSDWEQITSRYVEADGFAFMVHCSNNPNVVLADMSRKRTGSDTRCIDKSMKLGCQLQNVTNQGYSCAPCPPSQ
jgi:hypothetical protein